jgi:hypothetical protein
MLLALCDFDLEGIFEGGNFEVRGVLESALAAG